MSENICEDCGGYPGTRLQVEIEGGELITCSSKFHANLVQREAGAYEYLNESLVVIHTTSVPMTDQEALEYFSAVDAMFDENTSPRYITRRGLDEHKFAMMPYTYDAETGEVSKIEKPQKS